MRCMKKRPIIIIAAVAALSVSVLLLSHNTVAYLMDTEAADNVVQIGQVEVSLDEGGYTDSWYTFSDGEGQLGRTDAGLRMGCGLGVDHFFVELAYDCGLVNLASDQYNYFSFNNYDSAIRSNTISFSLGFNF